MNTKRTPKPIHHEEHEGREEKNCFSGFHHKDHKDHKENSFPSDLCALCVLCGKICVASLLACLAIAVPATAGTNAAITINTNTGLLSNLGFSASGPGLRWSNSVTGAYGYIPTNGHLHITDENGSTYDFRTNGTLDISNLSGSRVVITNGNIISTGTNTSGTVDAGSMNVSVGISAASINSGNVNLSGIFGGNGAGLTNLFTQATYINGPPKEVLEVGMVDQEDASTIAVAAWQHAHGFIDLQAVLIPQTSSAIMTAGAVNALLSYYGAPHVPIGVETNINVGTAPTEVTGTYPAGITWPNFVYSNYPNACTNASDWNSLLRRILAADPPGSVFFANNTPYTILSNFLAQTNIDLISTNSNKQLFLNSVGTMVGLGGDYTNGNEPNFTVSGIAAQYVQTNIGNHVWVGFSCGATNPPTPNTGEPVSDFGFGWSNNISSNNPLFNLQWDCFNAGDIPRQAWGTTIQMFIAYGTNYPSPYALVPGTNVILTSGSNYWLSTPVTEAYLGGLSQTTSYANNVMASNLINEILYQWLPSDDVPHVTGLGLIGGGVITSDSGIFNDLRIDDPKSTTLEFGSAYPSETVQIQDSINGNYQWVHGGFYVGGAGDHAFGDSFFWCDQGSPYYVHVQNTLTANAAMITNGITAETFTGNGSGLINTFNGTTNAVIIGSAAGITNTANKYGTLKIVAASSTWSNFDSGGNWLDTNTGYTGTIEFPIGPNSGIKSAGSSLTSCKIFFQ